MVSKAVADITRLKPDHPFPALYRQAGRRWLALVIALALLTWLAFFAGTVRNPGGVKRPWAVVASRAMAAAGAVLLVRLLLFSYEERVPVLYIRAARAERATAAFLERLGRRDDASVPLADIVAFVSERRYVPKGGAGLILESGTLDGIDAYGGCAESLKITLLLPPGAFAGKTPAAGCLSQPGLEVGLVLDPGHGAPGDDPAAALKTFADQSLERIGKRPVCARIGGYTPVDPKGLADATGYACFLGGQGLNRFGDNPYLVRPLDITPVLELGRQIGLNLRIYAGMFKGSYVWWPMAALLKALGATPRWD